MKYVIVYNDKEIAFADAVEDNTITYYPDKGYYCKVLKTEEEFLKAQKVIDEALIQKRIEVECVSCYKEWLTDMSVTYSDKATKEELQSLVTTAVTTSNYPKDKKVWADTVNKIFVDKKILTIIGLLVTVSLNSQIRKDYIDHYACGYLAGWSTGVLSGDYKGCKPIIISAGSAFVIGGAKELIYDKWLGRGTPEWKDLFATTLGGISAGVTIKMFAGLSKNKRNKHIFYHDRKRTEIHRR